MIETLVNITTACCYLITAGVVVKYTYSRFARQKNHQSANTSMGKPQATVSPIENVAEYDFRLCFRVI